MAFIRACFAYLGYLAHLARLQGLRRGFAREIARTPRGSQEMFLLQKKYRGKGLKL